ncbi:Serine/threonine-protein kinase RsbT [Roseibium album]|nr:Serine/threonine-protein kinase RsbT [Roseibium album]
MSDDKRVVHIRTTADIHNAIFAVQALARENGMKEGVSAAIATAVSELVTNVLKYAGTGRVSYQTVKRAKRLGIEAVVQDTGPGIMDIEEAMKESVSTSGTLGLGLPGAKRLVDEFEITSTVDRGTTVKVVKWG